LSSVERYDSAKNEWEEVASMGTKRWGVGVAVYGGHLYAVGGYNGRVWLSSVERYDSEKDKWEKVAYMGTEREGVGVAVYNGHLYAVGGKNGIDNYLNSVERYDSEKNKWEAVASIGTQRTGVGVAVYGGHLYAVGGWNGSILSSVERYDSAKNEWEEVASMGTKRWGVGVAIKNNNDEIIKLLMELNKMNLELNKLKNDNKERENTEICKVCLDNKRNVILIPCGHIALCNICANELKQQQLPCPICRGEFTKIQQVFFAGGNKKNFDKQKYLKYKIKYINLLINKKKEREYNESGENNNSV